jgi:hypothetical protein
MAATSKSKDSIQLDLVISKPCGLITFIDILADQPHVTKWVKDWYFRQSPPGQAGLDKEFISEYQELMGDPEESYRDEIGTPLTLGYKVVSIAASCKTLDELLLNVRPIFETSRCDRLKRVFDHFEPIYEKLVWEPRMKELLVQVEQAQTLLAQSKMLERLQSVRHFMRAPWVPGLPLTVCFIPLPKPDIKDPRVHGGCLGRVQLVELLPGKKSRKTQLDVIFHEACHAFWETRHDKEATVQADFERADGSFAYTELNEGMATALGQGWFYQLAFGKRKRKWYLDVIVDGYAKALCALITSYIEARREMDEEFAFEATKIFKKRFPKLKERAAPIQ